jgi:hypothetical protein
VVELFVEFLFFAVEELDFLIDAVSDCKGFGFVVPRIVVIDFYIDVSGLQLPGFAYFVEPYCCVSFE